MPLTVRRTPANQSDNLAKLPEDNCTICLEPLTSDEPNKMLDCSHLFHQACINSWLKHSPTCPNCRERVVTCLTPMPRPAAMSFAELQAVPDHQPQAVHRPEGVFDQNRILQQNEAMNNMRYLLLRRGVVNDVDSHEFLPINSRPNPILPQLISELAHHAGQTFIQQSLQWNEQHPHPEQLAPINHEIQIRLQPQSERPDEISLIQRNDTERLGLTMYGLIRERMRSMFE